MNKRLIKKMVKKREAFNGIVHAAGNNGADIVTIESLEEGMIYLSVGSSCVTMLKQAVPVEFLTGLIAQSMMDHNGDIYSVIDSFRWDQECKDQLKKKVRRY